MADILNIGTCAILDADDLKIISKALSSNVIAKRSKIVAFELISRHKRGLNTVKVGNESAQFLKRFRDKYQVFIEYIPNVNKAKAIKGWYLI